MSQRFPTTGNLRRGRPLKCVTVFCGATPGLAGIHTRAAAELGSAIARNGLRLVYGGATVGLMGTLADAALGAGGVVVGVIPQYLSVVPEAAHPGLTELHVVPDMHRRKAMMAELGDAFVALPGGVGTAEEFFEVLTWSHLRLHDKPCVLLDIHGYYRPLLAFIEHAVREGFIDSDTARRVIVCERVEQVFEVLRHVGIPGGIDTADA
ncbi:TIGR00730 family Rossman fold protein [Streptomyces sp. WI04-05B]